MTLSFSSSFESSYDSPFNSSIVSEYEALEELVEFNDNIYEEFIMLGLEMMVNSLITESIEMADDDWLDSEIIYSS